MNTIQLALIDYYLTEIKATHREWAFVTWLWEEVDKQESKLNHPSNYSN